GAQAGREEGLDPQAGREAHQEVGGGLRNRRLSAGTGTPRTARVERRVAPSYFTLRQIPAAAKREPGSESQLCGGWGLSSRRASRACGRSVLTLRNGARRGR